MCVHQTTILHKSSPGENPSFLSHPSSLPPCLRASDLLPPSSLPGARHPRSPYSPLPSGILALDRALGGGLLPGSLSEWGLPPGRRGREVILGYLRHHTGWSLWATPETDTTRLYPPAWAARGVDLTRLRWARTDRPLQDLKPALLSSVFPVIVLDRPPRLRPDDMAFLAAQARAHHYHVLILRDYFLSSARGNAHARARLNVDLLPDGRFHARMVRGTSGSFSFSLDPHSDAAERLP
jgi:hypothetical protein